MNTNKKINIPTMRNQFQYKAFLNLLDIDFFCKNLDLYSKFVLENDEFKSDILSFFYFIKALVEKNNSSKVIDLDNIIIAFKAYFLSVSFSNFSYNSNKFDFVKFREFHPESFNFYLDALENYEHLHLVREFIPFFEYISINDYEYIKAVEIVDRLQSEFF